MKDRKKKKRGGGGELADCRESVDGTHLSSASMENWSCLTDEVKLGGNIQEDCKWD